MWQRSKPKIHDDGSMINSDSEFNSDDDGCSSGNDQGCSSTTKHSKWDGIDEQHLLAYKRENKS